jgi:hypothetical protein
MEYNIKIAPKAIGLIHEHMWKYMKQMNVVFGMLSGEQIRDFWIGIFTEVIERLRKEAS